MTSVHIAVMMQANHWQASGELFFELNGQVHCIKAGEVMAIPSSAPHAVWTETLRVTAIDAWSPVMKKYAAET